MKFTRMLLVLSIGVAAMASASAATYRCLGADGKVTYADRPCEASQQTVATLDAKGGKKAAAPAPAASAAASAPAAATVVSAARPAPAAAPQR